MNKNKLIQAEEKFLIDVQYIIQKIMIEMKITSSELAQQLGISDQEFESIFSADGDIGIRLLARVFAVLDDECYLTSRVLRYLADRGDAVDFTMYIDNPSQSSKNCLDLKEKD